MHAQFLCPTDRRFLKRSSTERGSLGSQTPYRRHLPCGARRGARAGSRHCEFARPAQSVHALHTAVPTEPARSWSACSYRERSENRIVITPPHGRAPRLARPRAAPSSRLRASRNALPPWRCWPQASPAQLRSDVVKFGVEEPPRRWREISSMARTGSLAALGVVGLVPCAGARRGPPGRLLAYLSPCSGCAHMSVSDWVCVRACDRVGSACLCSAAPGGRWRTAASLGRLPSGLPLPRER